MGAFVCGTCGAGHHAWCVGPCMCADRNHSISAPAAPPPAEEPHVADLPFAAGHALDRRVAREVLGWDDWRHYEGCVDRVVKPPGQDSRPFRPSLMIEDAWLLVTAVVEKTLGSFNLCRHGPSGLATAIFYPNLDNKGRPVGFACELSEPLAICGAALAAMESVPWPAAPPPVETPAPHPVRPGKLAAGEQLDAIIAEKLMGLHKVLEEVGFGPGEFDVWRDARGYKASEYHPPRYSTDIAEAWKVVHRIIAGGHEFGMVWDEGAWTIAAYGIREKSAPLAICLAALVVIDMEGKNG